MLIQSFESDCSSIDEINAALFAHASGLSWVVAKRKGFNEMAISALNQNKKAVHVLDTFGRCGRV
jgi:hypothetical protein